MSGKVRLTALMILLVFVKIEMMSQVSDSLFRISCQHEDLIILSEDMEVSIIGKKLNYMHAEVSNNLTIIINSTSGIEKVQPVTLPRKFDELYIYHAPTIRNIDWEYQNINIKEFSASLIRQHNSTTEREVIPKVKKKRVLNNEGFFGNANIYEYYINERYYYKYK